MISNSHLKRHGITGQEYKDKFPGSVLRIQSEESKKKISSKNAGKEAWNKGSERTEEQNAHQSEVMKNKFKAGVYTHPMLGKNHSEESRQKISTSNLGMLITPEQKAKQRASLRAHTALPGYKNAMAGLEHSEETKKKIGAKVLSNYKSIRKNQEEAGYWVPLAQLPEVIKYRRDVWKITNKNVHLIPNYDESKRGLNSLTEDNYQVDHRLSIVQGFLDGITPEQMSHPANLRFIPWRDNLAKWHRSDLTKEELLEACNK